MAAAAKLENVVYPIGVTPREETTTTQATPTPDAAPRKRGRLQNLREFSVLIYQDDHTRPVGTGIAVRKSAEEIVIATCAHVVQDALGTTPPRKRPQRT